MIPTIHITGGLGFIGSNLIRWLNEQNIIPVIYDHLTGEKWRNVAGLRFVLRSSESLMAPKGYHHGSDTLIHLGANVDTREPFNPDLWSNNVEYSLRAFAQFREGRVIYASSAAVYGAEEQDFTPRVYGPKPINAYGFTKLSLDQAVFGIQSTVSVAHVYGLRFFNVYGRNEESKGDMASVVHKALRGCLYSGNAYGGDRKWSLFASERLGVANGEQARDFVHVDDVCSVIGHFALSETPSKNGLYNVGTGRARSFNELVSIIDPKLRIDYREMPQVLRGQYRYRTQADLTTLREVGYIAPFATLEEGIEKTR